ncbi:hypothetical protein EVAR_60940_1 [Eumeta japonica]|uniref:Uncharacterized protein n=1 Tax=Eumeta variegata TaxID=151549 RepID=A0A4C1ZCD0_EUMVA|nr:hypothetical protein EVAR_60940_1 [Eumeta japonica]
MTNPHAQRQDSRASALCSSFWRKQLVHLLLLKMLGENFRQSDRPDMVGQGQRSVHYVTVHMTPGRTRHRTHRPGSTATRPRAAELSAKSLQVRARNGSEIENKIGVKIECGIGIKSLIGIEIQKMKDLFALVVQIRSVIAQGFPNCVSRRPGASHVDATESSEPQGTLVSAVRILTNILRLELKLVNIFEG